MDLYQSFWVLGLLLLRPSLILGAPAGATVQTTSGPVTGRPASNATSVTEFLGIPFAQPPIGDLRFAAPKTFNSSKPINGTAFGFDCPNVALPASPFPGQSATKANIIEFFGGGTGAPQSEDCLTLNIWTRAQGGPAQPVLVWFHGGRFTLGNTNTPFYSGQHVADQENLVFISVNYRLNIFGFSGAPGEDQNVGLLDQRKAVEWIRENIRGFGGDPNRIIIQGQSAGGSAVDYWAYSYPQDPIVAGLISHSGTAFSFAPNTPEYARSTFLSGAEMLGCNYTETALACMRTKDYKELLGITSKVKPLPTITLSQAAFHPVVDNKTVFSLETYRSMARDGNFAKIPFLAGNTDYEAGFYKIAAYGQHKNLTAQQWDVWNLEGFTCAHADAAAARADAQVPVWRYRYFGDWDNLRLYNGSGAYHGSDLEMVFGVAEDVTGVPNTEAENQTSSYMMSAWATFCRNPVKGLHTVMNWPNYAPQGNTLVRLGLGYNPNATYTSPVEFDQYCAALDGDVAGAQGAF